MMVAAFASDPFKPATREQLFLRMALVGPAGSGKTWTALSIASELGKLAVIDTEHGSARKYGNDFNFNVIELANYDPREYIKFIQAAAQFGYEVIVIDSLSHAWNAPGGILDMVDKRAKQSQSGNKFTAWADATPIHNQLIECILSTPIHIIATMRSKTEYVMEKNERGKEVPRKVGLAPIQRDGMEFEFDIVAEMDMENNFMVSKTRCSTMHGAVIAKPGKNVAEVVKAWLTDGVMPELKVIENAPASIDPETGEIIDQPAPAKPERRIDTKPGTPDFAPEGSISASPTKSNGKSESLFQYLMKTIDHMRYTDSKARAGAITKLQEADILFDRMDRGEAVKRVNVYADLRDSGEQQNDAIEAVRKLVNKQGEKE